MANYHHKYVKHTDNISVYQKACHIDFLDSMKSLRSIILYTQINQLCENQSEELLRLTIFLWKSPKKMLDLLKDTQNSHSCLVQCCLKSGKGIPGNDDQEWPSKLETTIE